jgi:hypothetical protein
MRAWILLWGAILFQPDLAAASGFLPPQSQHGGIAGIVRGPTGEGLPGVSVEASSPALIEKTRTVVTDRDGGYRLVGLRSGTYVVSFTVPEFSNVIVEGVEVTSSVTATVNAVMRLGDASEVVTEVGELDTRSVSERAVTSRRAMDTLPTDRTFIAFASMTPGMLVVGGVQNVGGSNPENALMLQIHGSRIGESRLFVDGMSVMSGNGSGGVNFGNFLNNAMAQEVIVNTGALSPEFELSGVTSNVVTRQGANNVHGSFSGRYTNASLQDDNLSADLIERGLTIGNSIKQVFDANPSVGGPLVKDRVWLFSSVRYWGTHTYVAGLYEDLDPTALFYTPDTSRPAVRPVSHASADARLTAQVTPRNKVDAYYHGQYSDFGTCLAPNRLTAPSACAHNKNDPQWFGQVSWTSPLTSRVLLEAGATVTAQNRRGRRDPGDPTDLSSITDSVTGFTWRAPADGFGGTRNNQSNYRAAVTYVAGRHAVKAGLTFMHQWRITGAEHNNSVNYTFAGSVPNALTQFAEPATFSERVNYNLGLYAQDQWTVARLTVNAGVRADFLDAQVDDQHLPAGLLVGARDFQKIEHVPRWGDLSPRVGAAYDVFGTGRTVLKATLARYVRGESYGIAREVNPVESTVSRTTRSWTDRNGNYTPDCDLRNVAANGECGAVDDNKFGQLVPGTTYDEAVTQGFGVRPYNWGTSVSVEHQLFSRVTASAGYFRRWYGNFNTLRQNLAVSNADFSPYCITALTNPRFPGGGGHQVCAFYDVSVQKFGEMDEFVTSSDSFGRHEDVFDGFDFAVNAQLPNRARLTGGLSLGRERTDNCYVLGDRSLLFMPALAVSPPASTMPRAEAFCDVRPPMQPNAKIQVVYPLPWWDVQAAATFQSLPGPQILAQQNTTNAQIRPSLGRNLSSCGTNPVCSNRVLLDVLPPGTLYGERLNQVDLRVSKTVRAGRVAIRPTVSIYNLFNANTILQYNNRYTASWPAPTAILTARFVDFGVQIDF